MAQERDDALERILGKLQQMENQFARLDERLNELESHAFRGKAEYDPSETIITDKPVPPLSHAAIPTEDRGRFSEDATITGEPAGFAEEATVFTDEPTADSSPSLDAILKKAAASPPPPPLPAVPPVENPVSSASSSESPSLDLNAGVPIHDEAKLEKRFQGAIADLKPGITKKKTNDTLEMRIATRYLPWAALLCLAMALIYIARYISHGPTGKVIVSYLLSIGMIVIGFMKEKKYPQWARPVLAGGLAFSYFTTYAMGFFKPMQMLDSTSVKLLALAINVVVVFGIAHWKKSEIIGGTALVLGYITTGVVGNDQAAFYSSVALSIVALFFLWFNRWFVATAIAAAATYIAHFYIWKALPEAVQRTDAQNFWFHFQFLTLYFVVFTAASLLGRKPALEEQASFNKEFEDGGSRPFGRYDLLYALTQTNLAAYIAGMITVFKLTGVYWSSAYYFFFPMAALCAGLAFAFRGLRAMQLACYVAGTVCLSFGMISAASPHWLPLFLAAQAVGMLLKMKHDGQKVWAWLSLAVLAYSAGYLVTGGEIDILNLRASQLETVRYPAWAWYSWSALGILYAILWEKLPRINESHNTGFVKYMVAFGAGIMFIIGLFQGQMPDNVTWLNLAVPAAAALAFALRSKSAIIPVIQLAMTSVILTSGYSSDYFKVYNWVPAFTIVLLIVGYVLGYLFEKSNQRLPWKWSRTTWRTLYLWAAFLAIACYMGNGLPESVSRFLIAASFAASIAAAWALRSSAIGKSGNAFLLFSCWLFTDIKVSLPWDLLSIAIITLAVYPIALPRWKFRTGSPETGLDDAAQIVALIIAGANLVYISLKNGQWNLVLVLGLLGLFYAGYAALGRFSYVSLLVLAAGFIAANFVVFYVGENTIGGVQFNAASLGLCMAGVLLFVAAERLLKLGSRHQLAGSNPVSSWLKPGVQNAITAFLAIGSLILMILTFRIMPELRVFYFTGAMVAAAFVWIVFGFMFAEPIYRQAGFVVLCLGMVKGLVWDVLNIKSALYRIVSWSVMGLLALVASYLYTRLRSREEATAELTAEETSQPE